MSKKTITVCDGCGRELLRVADAYRLHLETERYWDGMEMSCKTMDLEFCDSCARSVLLALEKIAERMGRE